MSHARLRRHASGQARDAGETVARSRGFEWLARAGFVARGAIYLLMGVLAIKLALGVGGGRATDQQGALRTIAHQSSGEALLIATAVGLAGYSLWRFIRAAIGHGPEGNDDRFERLAALASAISYTVLCVLAIRLLTSGSSSSGTRSTQRATGDVLGWTGGPWLVAAAGVILIGVGFYQGYKGISRSFLDDAKTEQMGRTVRRLFTGLGVYGHVARMVVFSMVGYFLIKAAIDFDSDTAVGLDGALSRLSHSSYGPTLLGIVAAGLIGFGLFSIADSRYHRV